MAYHLVSFVVTVRVEDAVDDYQAEDMAWEYLENNKPEFSVMDVTKEYEEYQ